MSEEMTKDLLLQEDCERFVDLLASDDPTLEISAVDTEFMASHRHTCTACCALESSMGFAADDLPPLAPERLEGVLNKHFAKTPRFPWLKLGGALAAAAAAVLFIWLGLSLGTDDAAPMEPSDFVAESGRRYASGDTIRAGEDTFLTSESNLQVALARNSSINLNTLAVPRVSMTLEDGLLAAHLEPESGREVQVLTDAGLVTVTGTIFSVEKRDGSTVVGVVRGSVEVRSSDDSDRTAHVTTGQLFALPSESFSKMPKSHGDRVLALLRMSEKDTPAEAIEVDEARVVERPKPTEVAPQEVPIDKPVVKRHKKDASPADEPSSADTATLASPSEYIRLARERRKLADWRGAAESYKDLIRIYPASREANTALLALAELELHSLGKPAAALSHYDEYLRRVPAGSMAEEAMWGKCVALKALGQVNNERKFLQIFVEKFPGSMHIGHAQERLVVIRRQADEKK